MDKKQTAGRRMIEFDLILNKIGHLGRYQIMLCLFFAWLGVQACLHAVSPVFYAAKSPYRCHVPSIDDSAHYPNLTETQILNLTTPLDDKGDYDRCHRYNYNFSACASPSLGCVQQQQQQQQQGGADTRACDEGYSYDTSVFSSTIITEWDLVCGNEIYVSMASSVFMGGMWFGAILAGYLLDYIGRRYTILLMAIGSLLSGLFISMIKSYIGFVILRFFSAAFSHGAYLSSFVYAVEITGKYRTGAGIHMHTAFSVGYAVNSLIAYIFRDWRRYYFAISLSPVPYFIFHFLMPESPRWHFSNGRADEGIEASKMFCAGNGVELSKEDYEDAYVVQAAEKTSKTSYSCVDVFRPARMRWVAINTMFSWMVISMVYYGLSLNAGSLSGDLFLNNFFNGLIEIVGYFAVQLTMNRYGRRAIMVSFFFIQGGACLVSVLLKEFANGNQLWLTTSVVLALVGKACNAGSFAAVYNFTAELFPTVVRGNALGLGSMAARWGSIASPFIIYLQKDYTWLPATVFGVFGCAGGFASLYYPETMGRYMPQTIPEAELFYAEAESSSSQKNIELTAYKAPAEEC